MQKFVITNQTNKFQLIDTEVEFTIEIDGSIVPIDRAVTFCLPFLADEPRKFSLVDGALVVTMDPKVFEHKGITNNSITLGNGLSCNFEVEV